MSNGCPKTSEGWEGRYQQGDTPWDLGAPPPALVTVIAAETPPLRVIVPGAGFGHDAIAWAQAGHHVTLVDIAPTAITGARRLAQAAGVELTLLEADIFALPDADGAFDLVWEQTCFCAIGLEQRSAYAQQAARWLAPGGRMIALLWNHGAEGGPPFDVTPEDARAAFAPHFDIESLEPVVESAPQRWNEFLARMRRA